MTRQIILILASAVVIAALIFILGSDKKSTPNESVQNTIDDKTFLLNMIPHHQEAVDTATEVIERGGVIPEVKTLAKDIIEAQKREIADMKKWYEEWYGKPYVYTGEYAPMMRELEGLSGKDIDIAFTTDMWMHHMGAIHLAQAVLQNTQKPELEEMGNNILVVQQQEMLLMEEILRNNITN
tara:strand:+ start:171 stop:716 length:546 start_codon:yes stop_codon:yes gene_type:complete